MLTIAILGTGAIADSHIQAYLALPDYCRIVALADLYPENATQKATQHALRVKIYRDYHELIAREPFDAASVCLPPFEHAAATVALLRAGKHVLVEKPMATCLAECDAMTPLPQKASTSIMTPPVQVTPCLACPAAETPHSKPATG